MLALTLILVFSNAGSNDMYSVVKCLLFCQYGGNSYMLLKDKNFTWEELYLGSQDTF